MTHDDETMELRRITILERNADYYDAAKRCFTIYQRTRTPEYAFRGFDNLYNSIWRAKKIIAIISSITYYEHLLRGENDGVRLITVKVCQREGFVLDDSSGNR